VNGATAKEMADVDDAIERLNLALRLWAGCIWAAKTIAHKTLSGPNTPDMRRDAFLQIDAYAENDEIFAAGVEAAPVFLEQRGQTYSLDGVPPDSRVRERAQ
jgi:hypothetical protein